MYLIDTVTLLGELVSDIKFLVEGSAKLFKNLMPKIQRRGKLRSIEHPKAPLQTENSTVNESWSSSSDQKFFNPKLAIDDDVLSIEHRAPDEKTHLLVKQVHAGHAFLRTFIHKKDHQICSAWTTEPSSVYSLSREHLSKLISEHPSLAVDLQSAFVGVFQEQEEAEDMRKDAAQRLKFIEDLVKLQEASQPTKRPSSLERIQATCFPWRRRVHRPRFSECAGNYADVSSVTGNDDTTDDLLKQRRRSVSDPSVVPPVSIFEKNLIPSTASARRPLSQQQFDGKRPPSRRRSISDPSSS